MLLRILAIPAMLAVSVATARAATVPTDRGTIAVPSGRALIVWDATDATDALLRTHLTNAEAVLKLELVAVGIAAFNVPALPRADTITVRILYHKTADSGAYGAQGYDDAVLLAAVTLPASEVRKQRAKWTPPESLKALPKDASVETPHDGGTL